MCELPSGLQVRLSASVAVAVTTTPAVPAESLVALADAARYRAKKAGGDRYVTANPAGA